ncbi:disease resistance protein RGA2-like [Cucumis melo var. makuwa]|uniref:Disease resistance protein RGA2-like n=2 Tax=Cucumis melo TaxID=3656 RepID=A0A5D3CZK0_CUCMM|nr:disease resistance protein RGA2-like [Cucumis melo var. makuwa]
MCAVVFESSSSIYLGVLRENMAEFPWTYGSQEVLKKVLKVASEEIGVALGFKKERSKLTKWLHKSEVVLRDINTKKLRHDSVRMWVEDL